MRSSMWTMIVAAWFLGCDASPSFRSELRVGMTNSSKVGPTTTSNFQKVFSLQQGGRALQELTFSTPRKLMSCGTVVISPMSLSVSASEIPELDGCYDPNPEFATNNGAAVYSTDGGNYDTAGTSVLVNMQTEFGAFWTLGPITPQGTGFLHTLFPLCTTSCDPSRDPSEVDLASWACETDGDESLSREASDMKDFSRVACGCGAASASIADPEPCMEASVTSADFSFVEGTYAREVNDGSYYKDIWMRTDGQATIAWVLDPPSWVLTTVAGDGDLTFDQIACVSTLPVFDPTSIPVTEWECDSDGDLQFSAAERGDFPGVVCTSDVEPTSPAVKSTAPTAAITIMPTTASPATPPPTARSSPAAPPPTARSSPATPPPTARLSPTTPSPTLASTVSNPVAGSPSPTSAVQPVNPEDTTEQNAGCGLSCGVITGIAVGCAASLLVLGRH